MWQQVVLELHWHGLLAFCEFLFSHFSPVGVLKLKLHLTIPYIVLSGCLAEYGKLADMDLSDPLFYAQPCLPRE